MFLNINAPEIVILQDKNDENKLKQMLKYEIYEKERWRIVTWSSDLKEEDGAQWVKKGNNKNIYFDKKKLELSEDGLILFIIFRKAKSYVYLLKNMERYKEEELIVLTVQLMLIVLQIVMLKLYVKN